MELINRAAMRLNEELHVTPSVTDDGTMKTAKSIQKTELARRSVAVCVCVCLPNSHQVLRTEDENTVFICSLQKPLQNYLIRFRKR